MKTFGLKIPVIKVNKIINDDLAVIYYELYFDDKLEGRYQSVSSVVWRIGLMISEEALAVTGEDEL